MIYLRLLFLVVSAYASPKQTCQTRNLESCSANLPSNLCCPPQSKCISLAGDTTVLCCPDGRTCETISPIACDLELQDPEKHSTSPIQTVVFDVKLKTCGNGMCCPYGYSCNDHDESGTPQCHKDKDQSLKPQKILDGDAPATSSTSSATSQPTSTSSQDSSSSSSAAAEAEAVAEGVSRHRLISIIGGSISGCLILLLIVTIALLYLRRRRMKPKTTYSEKNPSSSTSRRTPPRGDAANYGNLISDPIVQPNSYRTDFILKSPSAESSISQRGINVQYDPEASRPMPHQQQQQQQQQHQNQQHQQQNNLTIPNPFNSPNPSARSHSPCRSSIRSTSSGSSSQGDYTARTGHVTKGKLVPIRGMRPSGAGRRSRHVNQQPSSETINIFADPAIFSKQKKRQSDTHTSFTDMMDEAELGPVHRGQRYVPGTTPRI